MRDLLLFLPTAWAVTAAGRSLLRGLRLPDDTTRLERNLIGFALGLGLLAYGVLALGLLHGLYPVAGWCLVAVLALLGGRSHAVMAGELRDLVRGGLRLSLWGWGLAVLYAIFASLTLIGVWTPPTVTGEWDSLSYHLADPKLYVQAHRIYPLPWESHSNFAFTAEMWYLFGLMESGVPLAKLFHFSCGAGASLAVYAFGRRHLAPGIGQVAALLFATTPLVLWEAGTAYVDLASAYFSMLTLLAFANGIALRENGWLRVAAVLMGLTLSTKATSLTTMALLAAGLLYWRIAAEKQSMPQAARALAVWCLLALAVGSPWYIKSTVYTGNPVYPFYYKLFGGRGFNAADAAQYDASNANFGVASEPTGSDPALVRTASQAALVPWNLIMYLLPGHPPPNPAFRPFSDVQLEIYSLSPLLLAALFFPAFLGRASGRAAPQVVRALGLYVFLSLLLWFVTMQYSRYLLPLLPALCLLAAWSLVRAWSARWLSGYALAGLAACSLAFSLYGETRLALWEAPVIFGQQSREDFITRSFAAYPAMQFINKNLPAHAKVVFYGSPWGYYCDKPYLWGDQQHSTVIPYDRLTSADDLRACLHQMGVTHILVNWRPGFFPENANAPGQVGWVYALTEGSGPPVFQARGVAVYALPEARK